MDLSNPNPGPCFKCGAQDHKAYRCPVSDAVLVDDQAQELLEVLLTKHPKVRREWSKLSQKVSMRRDELPQDIETMYRLQFLRSFLECDREGHCHFKSDCPESSSKRMNYEYDGLHDCENCGSRRHPAEECLWGGPPMERTQGYERAEDRLRTPADDWNERMESNGKRYWYHEATGDVRTECPPELLEQ